MLSDLSSSLRAIAASVSLLCGVMGGPVSGLPNCDPDEFATGFVSSYLDAMSFQDADRAIASLDTIADGICQQAHVVDALTDSLGEPIGYKVAVTSEPAQQQLGIERPVVGVLLADMLRDDGSTIAIASGAQLIYEVDLLVRVASDEINEAETVADVARNLDSVIPFIEVGDLMLPPGSRITGPLLTAMNAGARWGVVGEPIPVTAELNVVDALANMQVTMTDESGEILVNAQGSDILGHPLNSVLVLLQDLGDRPERLRAGDVVSLGTFGTFVPAAPGKQGVARYDGLANGSATVTVMFE